LQRVLSHVAPRGGRDGAKQHLSPAPTASDIPIIQATKDLALNPVEFLMKQKEISGEIFAVERHGTRSIYTGDPVLFDEILGDEDAFGDPFTPNMSVNHKVFGLPMDVLEKHERDAVRELRRLLLQHDATLASSIGSKMLDGMRSELGDSGEMDLRQFGELVFWPMTEALFGPGATKEKAPSLYADFNAIDDNFGAALRGKQIPAVQAGVSSANAVFEGMVRGRDQCPMAPLTQFYHGLLGDKGGADDDEARTRATAQLSTSAWWGGQGNTLPSTIWTMGLVLNDPAARAAAYAEVDRVFSPGGPGATQGAVPGGTREDAGAGSGAGAGAGAGEGEGEGAFLISNLEFLTAAFKETLRLKTYSVAWRAVRKATTVTSGSGATYELRQGDTVGLQFCMRHMDPQVFAAPAEFRPGRFLPGHAHAEPCLAETVQGGRQPYAWAPFSSGMHKCSGYPLAMMEIPVVMALAMREYELELVDPLPGMDWSSSFGVVGLKPGAVRVKYTKRSGGGK
jgi:cytochrome P450